MSTESCSNCHSKSYDLFKLPFGKLICDSCVSKQFKVDEPISVVPELPASESKDTNSLGIKLFRFKQNLNDFYAQTTNYESRIRNKFELIKFEINWNFNYCSNEIIKSKKKQLNELDAYETDLMLKFNNSKETNKFEILANLYAKFSDYFSQLSNKLNLINSLNDANTDMAQTILTQLDETEKQLISFEKYISDQTVELNQTYFFKKYLNFVKQKNLTSVQFGCLRSDEKKDPDETELNIGPGLKKIILENEQNIFQDKSSLFVQSIKTLNESENEMIVVQAKQNDSDYKLRMYGLKFGDLKGELEFNQKEMFMIDSNMDNLIVCHSRDSIEYNLELYDKNLKLIGNLTSSFNDLKPIDLFIDSNRVSVLLFDKKDSSLSISQLSLQLAEVNMLKLKQIDFNKNNVEGAKFNLFTIENKIFLKQIHLFGTRLNYIDSTTGNCLTKFDLNFFLLNNNFIIDKSYKLVVFSLNDSKFLIYDLNTQKLIYKLSFAESKYLFSSICLTRDGSIISLLK